MSMTTTFLQNDTLNLPNLFVIGIVTSDIFCGIYFTEILLACFQIFEASWKIFEFL